MEFLKTSISDSLISTKNISSHAVILLLQRIDHYRTIVETNGYCDDLKGRVIGSVFFEPSTRTSCSFKTAVARMGGTTIDLDIGKSSILKGESYEDTIRTMSCYSDCIVHRHPERHSAEHASRSADKPIINAGDGCGEHPTQALLDFYTIYNELTFNNPLCVGFFGDLTHSRTVHSLFELLSRVKPETKIYLIAPDGLQLPEEIIHSGRLQTGIIIPITDINDCISELDVLYVTRIQKERFQSLDDYETVRGTYKVDASLMNKAKAKMIVMHPLPRENEIDPNVDSDPRAAYFRQMKNGVYARMAILDSIINKTVSLQNIEKQH